jgi:hypothetical protein
MPIIPTKLIDSLVAAGKTAVSGINNHADDVSEYTEVIEEVIDGLAHALREAISG